MNAILNLKNIVSDLYIVTIIAILGVFAFFSAILLAWPALAYLASKIML